MSKKNVLLRLDQDIYDALMQEATEQSRSVNNLIETVLKEYAEWVQVARKSLREDTTPTEGNGELGEGSDSGT